MNIRAGWYKKLGIIYISSSTTIEREWHMALPDSISFHTARISLKDACASEKDIMDMVCSEQVEEAAGKLAEAEVDVIVFACTIGSLIGGLEWDKKLVKRIEKAAGGIPSTSTSSGLINGLKHLNAKNVSVVTPYVEELNVLEKRFLESNGFNVLNIKGFNVIRDQDIAKIEGAKIIEMAKEVNSPEADCIFISCTNTRSIEVIEVLERELKKPVLSSNQVSLWDSLRIAGYDGIIEGYGSLLRRMVRSS